MKEIKKAYSKNMYKNLGKKINKKEIYEQSSMADLQVILTG